MKYGGGGHRKNRSLNAEFDIQWFDDQLVATVGTFIMHGVEVTPGLCMQHLVRRAVCGSVRDFHLWWGPYSGESLY